MTQLIGVSEVYTLLRQHDFFGRDLPDSMTISYPMAKRLAGGGVDLLFFIYPDPPAVPAPATIQRPTHWVEVAGETGSIRLFAECNVLDFAPPGQPAVINRLQLPMSLSELRQAQQRQFAAFDSLVAIFATGEAIDDATRHHAAQYFDWLKIANPDLLPFYRYLAPEFYEWVTGAGHCCQAGR